MAPLVWLVTGCSSGFGEVFVRQILERGDKIIATARRPDSIEHLKKTGVATLKLDVTDDQATINETMYQAIAIHGHIDVLVNNAAYIATGAWEDVSEEEFRANFDTNVFGVIKVTKAILPHFRERRTGTNVFISSRSGWCGDGFVGPYSGTKFALEGIVESLWRETEPLGLRTLLVEPGRFRTLLLSPENVKITKSKIPDYIEASKIFNAHITGEDRKQSGDVEKGWLSS
ncbi:putative oxidoreductase YusZ [Cladobotryum mycophilum]|uniref:Oxidoreductase YusZ n=1 Tax=Cladobotryum mycophilum TaxID=491253 RepID=A0ABR0T141_9HYPO